MGILSGVRVLDLSRIVAGPWATQTLADLGAEVIKIEKPDEGDDTRRMGPFIKDQSGQDTNDSVAFLSCNRGKKSVTIDISSAPGQALMRKLAAQSDVFVENFKAGALAHYGLDYASIQAINPRIIYCSITGFGIDGPYAGLPAYDFILQAMSGLMSTCGYPDGTPGGGPMRSAIPITDLVAGLYATISILAALTHREQTGFGQFIDAALLDASVALSGHLATGYLMTGKLPARIGNANHVTAPSDVFRTSDGYIIAGAGNSGQFKAFMEVLGRPELVQDPRFDGNVNRLLNRRDLSQSIEALTVAHDTAYWIKRLNAAGVPCGPINDFSAVFDDPQVIHRGIKMEVVHGRGVTVPTIKSPLNLSAAPVEYRAAPMLGADTEAVLQGVLELSNAEIEDLREKRVV